MNGLHRICPRILAVAVCLLTGAEGAIAGLVTIGNPGNDPDTRYASPGYGSVAYDYRIGEYEVTNAEYIAFLNSVAVVGDANFLYNASMAGTYGGGIQRTGSGTSGDPWFYLAKGGDTAWLNRPVNCVSWYDTLRYANWLHNGQPTTGGQVATTTEDGAYDMSQGASVVRKTGALFFLPTEDEWYKAAYHDKSAGLAASYFDFPTGTDTVPSNALINPDPGNNANFYDSGYTLGSPYYTTLVGEFENSLSPYGTFDQGGNLWEWNELDYFGDGSFRGVRGGCWGSNSGSLHASAWVSYDPAGESNSLGFRVASPYTLEPVPEPSTLLMLVMGLGGGVALEAEKAGHVTLCPSSLPPLSPWGRNGVRS